MRRARGLTQTELADIARLSPDTVRRVERGSFSPSLATIRRLCGGLGVSLTTLFAGYELGESTEGELADALRGLGPERRRLALELVRVVARV